MGPIISKCCSLRDIYMNMFRRLYSFASSCWRLCFRPVVSLGVAVCAHALRSLGESLRRHTGEGSVTTPGLIDASLHGYIPRLAARNHFTDQSQHNATECTNSMAALSIQSRAKFDELCRTAFGSAQSFWHLKKSLSGSCRPCSFSWCLPPVHMCVLLPAFM